MLTAGVDVQDDRLEVEVVGWGAGEESWSIDYRVLHGDPSSPQLWQQLDEVLLRTFEHPIGKPMIIRATCVDSGGHHTRAVYNYAKTRAGHRVFAIKGVGGEGKPIVGRPSKNNIGKVPLYPVGVDTAKEMFYARLRMEEPGPGYCHFHQRLDDEHFRQLTAEKQVIRYHKGYPKRGWIKTRTRNEALDVRIYAIAALAILNVNLDNIAKRYFSDIDKDEDLQVSRERANPLANPRAAARRKGGFVNNWR